MNKLLTIIFVVCICSYNSVSAQIISTIAGGGTFGLGDGGLATAAQLQGSCCLIFDNGGNLYFAGGISSPRIRMINTLGIINTIVDSNGTRGYSGDNGPAAGAQINYPAGIAIDDRSGSIYIADWYNHNIRKIDSLGIITTFAGNGIAAFSGDGGLAINASITPVGLCFDIMGDLYVIDTTSRIRKIDTNGIITTVAGNGTYGFSGDGGLADTGEIAPNYGIRVYGDSLYIGDGDRIRAVNLITGIINTVAGNGNYLYNGEGINADSAQFEAYTIDIDAAKNIYISDLPNQRVREINASGVIHTIAGNGTAGFSGDGSVSTLAEIHDPEGIAIDSCGNVYIADNGNNRIRKVLLNPNCWPENVQNVTTTNTISVYPNPAYNELTITTSHGLPQGEGLIKEVTLYNLIGQVVYAQVYNNEKAMINIEALPEGVYMVAITDDEGNKTVKKIVKE